MEDQNDTLVKPAFTALVLGGEDFAGYDAVSRALDSLLAKHGNLTILTSDAQTGTDALARRWSVEKRRPYIGDPRGLELLVAYLPSGVVAFPGADTTAAERAKIKVWRPAGLS